MKHRKHKPAKSSLTGPSTGPKPAPLPTNVQDLQAMVMALQHQVTQLQRMLFGRRSERLLPDDPSQGFLFGRIEPQEPQEESQPSQEESAPSSDDASEEDEEPAPQRRNTHHHGRRPLPVHLMRCVHDDVVFDYTNSHKRDGPASFLKDYRGYLQADAFSGYDGIYAGGLIFEVACWAHARRKFYDTLVHYPAEAKRVLELIGSLYAVESRAKELRVPADRLLAWRQRFSRRRLAQLHRYLDQLSVQVLPKNPLGKAISYTLKNWQALNRYTEAAWLSIDNNLSERQIKQMVIGRKAWLFAGSENGARNAATLFSIIVSCKLAGVDPFAYLRDILTRLQSHPADRIHELVPHEWKKRFAPQALPHYA